MNRKQAAERHTAYGIAADNQTSDPMADYRHSSRLLCRDSASLVAVFVEQASLHVNSTSIRASNYLPTLC